MAKNVVVIGGNIGAGKSTLTDYIQQREQSKCIPEFVDSSWLELFYSDRKSFTGYLEKSCLFGRIARNITAKKEIGNVFFDRGLIEAREVFVQNSFDEGFLSRMELNSYDYELHEAINNKLGISKHDSDRWLEKLFVYMEAPPEVCFERQKERARKRGDRSEIIPLDYFKRLDKYYSRFVTQIGPIYNKWGLQNPPKIVPIPAHRDISKDKSYLEEAAQIIMDELGKYNECH